MSRNKDIEFLHNITGEPYRICRARMKACNWNVLEALQLSHTFDAMSELLNNIKPAIADAFEAFASACQSVADSLR